MPRPRSFVPLAALCLSVSAGAAPAQGTNTLSAAEVDRLLTRNCQAQYQAVRQFFVEAGYDWKEVDTVIREGIGVHQSRRELNQLRDEAAAASSNPGQAVLNALQVCMIDGKLAILDQRGGAKAAKGRSSKIQ